MTDIKTALVNGLQRRGTRTFTAKLAQDASFMDMAKNIWNDPAKRQILTKGLLGAGLGAATLGGLRATRKGDKDKAEKARGVVTSALLGAMLGGTAGTAWGFNTYVGQPAPIHMEDIEDKPGILKRYPGTVIGTATGTALAARNISRLTERMAKEQAEMLAHNRPAVQVLQPYAQDLATAQEMLQRAIDTGASKVDIQAARDLVAEAARMHGGQMGRQAKSTMEGLGFNPSRARAGRIAANLALIPAGAGLGYITDRLMGNPAELQRYYDTLNQQKTELTRALRLADQGRTEEINKILEEIKKRM